MRLLDPTHVTILTDPYTWLDNPFIRREWRRERKRRQPLLSITVMAVTLALFCGLAWWGLSAMHRRGYGNAWFVGGNVALAIAVVLSGLHLAFVVGAAQKHTLRMLVQEVAQNTLPSLLTLPTPPFQLVIQSIVYPWLAAMRQAVLLLPVYVFLVGLNGLSWLDVLMLYVVYALSSISFPRWNRPVLSENAAMTNVAPAQTQALAKNATISQTAALSNNANPGYSFGQWLSTAFLLPYILLIFQRGRLTGVRDMLAAYLPESLLLLLPTSFLSWPLMIARGLVTPLDWYGLPVPPLLFVLPLFFAARYTQAIRLAEFLSVGTYRDLVALPTYHARRRLEGRIRVLQVFVTVGYLWRWGVVDGGMSFLVSPGVVDRLHGLLGFLYLLLFVTLGRGIGRSAALAGWLREGNRTGREAVHKLLTVRSTVRYLAEPFVFALGLALAACLVSRTYPFPPEALALAGKMLAIGLPAMLLRFSADRVLGFLANAHLLIVPFVLYYPTASGPLKYLSPALGLIGLGNPAVLRLQSLFLSAWPWWVWAAALGLAALPCALLAALMMLRRARRAPKPDGPAFDPTRVGTEAYLDAVFAETKAEAEAESPLYRRLIAAVQTVADNAVLIKEMRARLRGKLSFQFLQMAFIACLVITLIAGLGLEQIALAFGSGIARMLYGPRLAPSGLLWGSVLGCWYIALIILALSTGISFLPQAFSVENEKSTLGFLFSTLLRPPAIVFGKLFGLCVTMGMGFWILTFWTLLMSAALVPLLGLAALTAWGAASLTALTLYLSAGSVVIAVASLFPRINSTKAATWLQILLFYGMIILPSLFGRWLGSTLGGFGLQGGALWLAGLLLLALLAALALLLTILRVERMQRGDVAFGAARRDN